MLPAGTVEVRGLSRPPRASGGASRGGARTRRLLLSSPRERGCFHSSISRCGVDSVLPARAGVLPWDEHSSLVTVCPPRASGGASPTAGAWVVVAVSSPRERGCFLDRAPVGACQRVLPARAGVLPTAPAPSTREPSPPRASGGASAGPHCPSAVAPSSPRERGCFRRPTRRPNHLTVLPARAGVLPGSRCRCRQRPSPPRASGGASLGCALATAGPVSSPRERGCFLGRAAVLGHPVVLPARAAVLPPQWRPSWLTRRPPRASGGASIGQAGLLVALKSSPRERGCFRNGQHGPMPCGVLPARAGVLPTLRHIMATARSPPRASGGASRVCARPQGLHASSPRERGCFLQRDVSRSHSHVLPARAGVLPSMAQWPSLKSGPPRASGGASWHEPDQQEVGASSPRERGCFRHYRRWTRQFPVLPARAGVLPPSKLNVASLSSPPRASGGASWFVAGIMSSNVSSPRERGCFLLGGMGSASQGVLPARAGVLPLGVPSPLRGRWSSPRERGCYPCTAGTGPAADVLPARAGVLPVGCSWRAVTVGPPRASGGASDVQRSAHAPRPSSPRERGCFLGRDAGAGRDRVLPARAGVLPLGAPSPLRGRCPPRASGGASWGERQYWVIQWSSPRERGCFRGRAAPSTARAVLPARAGVLPESPSRDERERCPPRASGGASVAAFLPAEEEMSSPRERGCFLCRALPGC